MNKTVIYVDKYSAGFFSKLFFILYLLIFSNNTNYIIEAENFHNDKLFKKHNYENVEKISNYNNEKNRSGYYNFPYNYTYPNFNNYPYPLSEFKDYNYYIFCNTKIYSHHLFNELRLLFNEYYNKLIMTEYLINNINEKKKIIKNTNILGVFLRDPCHYGGINDFLYDYIDEIKQIEHKYDKILLISCVKKYNYVFKETFKNKLIYFTDKELVEINKVQKRI